MVSPFPGMDPYLESPEIWPDVHLGLIAELRNVLSDAVGERYYVAVEQRSYVLAPEEILLVGRPDLAVIDRDRPGAPPRGGSLGIAVQPRVVTVPGPEEIHERYLEIRAAASGDVVTAIEILSPANKRRGAGQDAYMTKRAQTLSTRTSLVEIDLLRAGERPIVVPDDGSEDYRILVARGSRRPRAELYSFEVKQPIPPFPVPLATSDPEIGVELRPVLDTVYDRARYRRRIDYAAEPVPVLAASDATWAASLLAGAGLRARTP